MDNLLLVYCISLLILLHNTESHGTNDSDDALRVPRVSGRIVKVYSGTRPDPIHCTGEGFQGDPTNCAVFYRCMKSGNGKFTVFRFQCGPGTVYDPDTEVCNHPRSTRRKECGGMVDSSYNDQTHLNEIDNAAEIPSPIVTKQPVYTESTIASKPVIPTQLSTQDSNVSTVSPWSSSYESSPINHFTRTTSPPYRSSTLAQNYDKISKRTVHPNHPHHPTPQSTQASSVTRQPNYDICTSDGFMGDSKNCRKFYRCVSDQRGGYIKYEFSCSESTMWDDDIQSCNHPWAIKRSRCGKTSINNDYLFTSVFKSTTDTTTQQQLITTSHPNQTKKEQSSNNKISSSNQQQTQISYGSKVTQTQTQISNGPVTQNQTQINYSDRVNQTIPYGVKQNQTQMSNESAISQIQTQISHGEKGTQTQLQIDHSNQSSQMQIQINEISTKLPTTIQYYNNEKETHTTHVNKNDNNNKCTESGFMGDDNDCKKFYRCVDNGRKSFTRYEFSCGEGTVWDSKIEACNHAWAVKECGGKVSTEIIGQTTEPSTTSTQSYYTTPTKSTQNYITSSSTIVLDKDEDINDDSGYGNHIQQQTTTYSTTIKETTTKSSKQEDNYCKSSGFIGDVNNCKKFYRCVDNGKGSFTKYEFQCGEGTVWDPDIEACNHAWAVKKCGGTDTNNDKVDSTTNSATMDFTYQVVNTVSTPTSTQTIHQNDEYDTAGNGYNNDEIPQITSTTTKKPQNQDITVNTCISSGFMGDKNDCKKFYRCVDNGDGTYVRYEFSCGEGTVWDPKIEACNHPWAVEKCGGSGSKPAYNDSSSESSSTVGYEEVEGGYPTQSDKNTGIPTQSTSTIKSTTAVLDIENNSCKKSGFMGDNNDCKKFYRCVDNGDGTYMRYEFSCGEGTVWDPKIEACNHPWAVDKCGGSISNPSYNETFSESSSTTGYEEIEGGYPTQSDKDTDIPTQSTSTIKSTTAVIDIENNNCIKSGFMGDSNDCKKFYRCVDNGDGSYMRYEFSCGEGTVWDPKIKACNHAWAVEKCGSISETTNVNLITSSENPIWSDEEINNGYPSQNDEQLDKTTSNPIFESTTVSNTIGICKNSGFIGDKHDCKKFYRCVDDGKGSFIKYEFSCGEGTAWDQSIESCNHAGSVKNCGTSTNQSTPIHSESTTQNLPTTISETGNGYYPQATEGSSTIGQPQESVVSNVCTKEGFVGDKNDCKKFYRCVDNNTGGFIQYNFVCGEGTVWVQDIQACDHATSDQPCGSNTNEISKEPSHENDEIYTDTSIKTSTTSSIQVSGSTSASENPQTSNFFCKSEGFFGDTKDCMKFYRCVDDGKESFTKYDFICGEGTFWDQDIQACNHITESKNCTKSHTSSTSLATDSNLEHSSTPIITEQQSSTEKSQTSTSSTDDTCIYEGFFPNPNDCSKFFRCVSDGKGGYIKYEFSCGEGTVWVQDIQACDYDDNIPTCNKQNGSTKPQTTEVYQSSTQATDLLSSTSLESQIPEKQDDEYPENGPITGGQCLSEGFHADNSDCKRFYRCVDDGHGGFTKYDFVCGEGTAWDENIQGCNHIGELNRCQSSIQETHTQSVMQDEEISQSTEGTSTTKIASSSESSDSTTTIAGNNKCEKEGYFGNTEDCKQFYRCVDNGNGGLTKYEFTCGEGTIWDQDITTCNHPEDVTNPSCKQKESSTTSSSSSSTSLQSSTSTTESSNQNSNNCSHEQSSKEPVHKNITCDKAGYFGDPNDCKKFYRCVDWDGDGQRFSVYHFDCGEGTIWDPALDTCNHEESVYPPRDCSGTQSQNEIITDNSTTSTQEDTTTEQLTTQQASSTTEQSTTQQTGTSEHTVTEQSTTSEQTTTQQSTASEQTTSEQTTTQQSTASEQTTTQQATTSEHTTTQSTSTQHTTDSQPTTTEQTITQETSSSEPTTTQQSTTSEQTTTQQTTSSEPTTTQKTTSSEPTTTQKSTTSEETTTQQSTTSEQVTTQQTTTQKSTTPQETTTTEQSTTTQQSTNSEQTTTEQTTKSESTTQQSTTNENTTEKLTSTEQTTDGTITEQQTSEASTTESSSTEQSSSTTEQSSEGMTTTEGKQETSTEESSSNKECPDTEDNQYLFVCPTSFRRHPKYCNLFYQCTEDNDNHDNKIAVFTCPNNTIYDESKTQCVEEEKSDKKCGGEIAQRRRFKRLDGNHKEPIVVGVEKQSCQTVGNLPFEKKFECSSAFLKCKKSKSGALRGFVYKCPEGYIYWSISRRCELMGNLSDCKRSNNNWDKRWEIPVEKTNIDSYKYKLIRPSSN